MDSLNYNYYKGTNQLSNVRDAVAAINYSADIDDEPSKYNYKYNSIGELVKDSAGGIASIDWTIYGKVQDIVFNQVNSTDRSIIFVYDPLGNRIEKIVKTQRVCYLCLFPPVYDTTKYVRDAQGNILAIYHKKNDTMHLIEWDIYGSKRIGVVDTNLLVYEPVPPCPLCPIVSNPLDSATIQYLEGQKQYELTNHLGNVLVTVSDKVTPIDTMVSPPNIANYYEPVIVNAQDYYPFGMVEPGRNYQLVYDSTYRFGYQGSMKVNDIYGNANAYTTKNRELDDRLARWWSPDPMVNPSESPYVTMGDNPIWYNDILGDKFTNGYESDEKNKKSKLDNAKSKKDGLDASVAGLRGRAKRDLTKEQRQALNSAKIADKEYNKAERKFEKTDAKYQCVQAILQKVQSTNPKLFSEVDNIR